MILIQFFKWKLNKSKYKNLHWAGLSVSTIYKNTCPWLNMSSTKEFMISDAFLWSEYQSCTFHMSQVTTFHLVLNCPENLTFSMFLYEFLVCFWLLNNATTCFALSFFEKLIFCKAHSEVVMLVYFAFSFFLSFFCVWLLLEHAGFIL